MSDTLLKYKIGIELIPKIGSISAKKLIAFCGGVEAVFKQSKRALLKIPGVGEVLANEIINQKVLDRAELEIEFIQKFNIRTYFYLDPEYPERLRQCEDGPVMFYLKGSNNINLNQNKFLSVVGTRKATDYGKDFCLELISSLSDKGINPVIVSGLAYGIDIAAHKAAINNKMVTIAVLGHGLDTIYPIVHRSVAKEIINDGALITDFISKTKFDRNNFIKRNRIIAGLSDATLVVESGVEGGALITADIALSYNRDVLALPGNVNQQYSKGCNYLIKSSKAALVESADDVAFILGWESSKKSSTSKQIRLFPELSPEEKIVVDYLRSVDQETLDVISANTKMPVSKVSSLLLNLEFSGIVKCKPGKVFTIS